MIIHYEHFPCLIFYSNNLNYSFELKHEDLFEIKGDRFYFLIVFESDPPNKNTQEWVIGEHFIKKHIFSYNIKTKKIWFYNEKNFNQNFKENDDDEDDETKEKEKEKGNVILKKENNKNLFIVLLIIFAIFFSIFSFYLGIKIKERRKKKANELIDEYEYFSERETKNKSINNINNDKSNNRKIKYEIELNSKI